MIDVSQMHSEERAREIVKLDLLATKADAVGTVEAKANAARYKARADELRAIVDPAPIQMAPLINNEVVIEPRETEDLETKRERERQEWKEWKQREKQRKEQEAAEAWAEFCPPQYNDTDPAKLPDQKHHAEVMAWKYGPKGLMVHGPSRRGKSRSCWMLLKRLRDEGHTSLQAFDGFGWFAEVGKALRDMEQAEAWMSRLVKVDVPFLDDIFRGSPTDAQELALWGVIERRTAANKPIIATTNMTGKAIEAKVGDRYAPIIERLREFCFDVSF